MTDIGACETSPSGGMDQRKAQSALQRMRDRAQQLSSNKLSLKNSGSEKFDWESIKALRDEGRR
jgi:hypothetical protein